MCGWALSVWVWVSFKLNWLLRSSREVNTSSWRNTASYRDMNVPGDTRSKASCSAGRAVCLRADPEGLHTVVFPCRCFTMGQKFSSEGGEKWSGATSPFHICPSAPWFLTVMVSVASLKALWTLGADMKQLPVQYCLHNLPDGEARHHLRPTIIHMDS